MNKSFAFIKVIIMIVIITILVAIAIIIIRSYSSRSGTSCEIYQNFTIQQVPVRCLEYFNLRGGEINER